MRTLALFGIAFALLGAGPTIAAPPAGTLTLDALIDIKHPSSALWSPKGDRIAFLWDRAGDQNVWVIDWDGARASAPRALTSHAGLVDALFWTPDGKAVFFSWKGDLWRVAADGSESPRALWTTSEVEREVTPSPDGSRFAFVRGDDIWVRQLADGREIRLTQSPSVKEELSWSPDGARLAFSFFSSSPREESLPYVGPKVVFRRWVWSTTDVAVVLVSGGQPVTLAGSPGTESAPRWLDSGRLGLQRVSEDLKTRAVLMADVASGQVQTLYREIDPKFWSLTYLNSEPVASPDGRFLAFISDADGWDHLYLVSASGGPAVQLTRGRFEVSSPAWSPDGKRIAFDANRGDLPGSRQLGVVDLGADRKSARVSMLTAARGTHTRPSWSPDGRWIAFQRTDPRNSADFYLVDAVPAATPRPNVRLTDSMPASVDRAALVEPKFVRYPAPDGQSVPAYLFVPSPLPTSRRHPAIIWVHGDGITQNYDGWHLRRDYAVYYSFHQYLAQKGYVVLAVDYRGSIGYGKEWRQGHFRDLGGKDYEDVAAGVDYLKTLGYVEGDRIGVWGLSYGGFMALQALTVTPRLFRCGINVAGVVDWRDWFADPDGPWIKGRMGAPEEDPALYKRTAPIERAARMERPLMVLHGTADINVPFVESVRLVDVLTRLGKEVEFMMYPGEYHYFHRAHVLRDAWTRVERFFEKHLREDGVPAASR